ncbi:MAG: hypothetical protein HY298_09965 [Verrucomicrobia bacterium]|nr:hypothetical protein [Verrucomicrobiota bacterium]
MKTNQVSGLLWRRLLGGLLLVFLAGCATSPKVDWAARVGTYTYDQAVTDLGPPDKSAKLTDGTTVAEWLTARGYGGYSGMDFGYGGYYGRWPYYYYGPVYHYYDSPTPDYYLRLTFGPDGKLKDWKRLRK